AGGFFQGIPAGGSASGTAVLVGAGAGSRWANILAGAFVVILTLTLGWLVELLPMSALAGLLIVIGVRMVNVPAITTVWNTSSVAAASMVITFASALVLPLQYAVLVGVAVAVLLSVAQQAEKVRLVELVWSDEVYPVEQPAPQVLPSDRVTSLTVYGSLFFAAAANVETSLPEPLQARNAVVLLGLRGHQEVGSTLLAVIDRYARRLEANGNRLILVGVSEDLLRQLEKTGLSKLLGENGIFPDDGRLGHAVALAYDEAVRWLTAKGVELRPARSPLLTAAAATPAAGAEPATTDLEGGGPPQQGQT
ncbi:MAG: SulP family inorganic anion transporter, partial [Caldilineaceae bacterium]